jgi:hypothetical protein
VLPAGHAEALLNHDNPAAVHAVAPALIGMVGVLDHIASSYRTGDGVPYSGLRPRTPPRHRRDEPPDSADLPAHYG